MLKPNFVPTKAFFFQQKIYVTSYNSISINKNKQLRTKGITQIDTYFILFVVGRTNTKPIAGEGGAGEAGATVLREPPQGCEGKGKGLHQGGDQGQHRIAGSRGRRPREGSPRHLRQGQAGD